MSLLKKKKGFSVRTDRSDYLARCGFGIIHWNVVSCVFFPQLSDSIILYSCFISWNSKMKGLSRAVCFRVDIYSLIAFRFTSTFRRWPGEEGLEMCWVECSKKEVYINERININEIYCTEFVDCYFCTHFLTKWFSMSCFIWNLHFWEDSPLMIFSLLGFWWATHLPTRFLGLPPRAGTWS